MTDRMLSEGNPFFASPSTVLGLVSAWLFVGAIALIAVVPLVLTAVVPGVAADISGLTLGHLNVAPAIGFMVVSAAFVTGAVALVGYHERSWAVQVSSTPPPLRVADSDSVMGSGSMNRARSSWLGYENRRRLEWSTEGSTHGPSLPRPSLLVKTRMISAALSQGSGKISGRVRTYGRGRVCAAPGCDTLLSAYNPAVYCALHVGVVVPGSRPLARGPAADALTQAE